MIIHCRKVIHQYSSAVRLQRYRSHAMLALAAHWLCLAAVVLLRAVLLCSGAVCM
jgi:hypothetical protein